MNNEDLSNITPEQATELSKQLGEMVGKIINDAIENANKYLGVYSLELKLKQEDFLIIPK